MVNLAKYETNGICIDARLEDGQAWLTYEQAAELFGVDESTIGKHVRGILDDSELTANCAAQFAVQVAHGSGSRYTKVVHVNQDMVLHVGYRVRSERGAEFRRWATMVLKGEAAPLALPVASDPIAALQLAQTAAIRYLADKQAETAARVANLEAHRAKTETELDEAMALPPAPVDVSQRSFGQMSIALMKAWGKEHGGAFDQATRMLYVAVLERPETRIDLRSRLEFAKRNKERGKKPKRVCDLIDESGKAVEIYAIARQLFAQGKVE